MKKATKLLTILVLVTVAGFAGNAFARMGMGPHNMMGPGFNDQLNNYSDLTAEQIEALNKSRQTFAAQTAELRQELRSKHLEMQFMMSQKTPDVKKVKALQKEISTLMAQLEEKRLDHQLGMKKIAPNYSFGMGPGKMGGYGRGMKGGCMGGPGMMGW